MKITETPIWKEMLSGRVYDAPNVLLVDELRRVRSLVARYNAIDPADSAALDTMLREIVAHCGENVTVNQPFRCDYGHNITLGDNVFVNFNFTVLDEAHVVIGDNTFIGPGVSIFTACHPLSADERNTGVEWAEPVTIGSDCWIGGNVTVLPGVTIGRDSVIGAGSVVTRDVPAGEVWAGNPARKIKEVDR